MKKGRQHKEGWIGEKRLKLEIRVHRLVVKSEMNLFVPERTESFHKTFNSIKGIYRQSQDIP